MNKNCINNNRSAIDYMITSFTFIKRFIYYGLLLLFYMLKSYNDNVAKKSRLSSGGLQVHIE